MKNSACIVFFLFVANLVTAQNWQWARSGNNIGEAKGNAIASHENYIYTVGYFEGNLTLDTITLMSHGKKDGYLAKYSKVGDIIWAKNIGGKEDDDLGGITIKDNDNIFIVGTFNDTIMIGNDSIYSKGETDILLLKIDSSGSIVWYKTAGGIYEENLPGVTYDGITHDDENVYITGYFASNGVAPPIQGTALFDTVTLTSYGDGDIFFAKYNLDGDLILAKNAGSRLIDFSGSIGVDSNKNIYISGNCDNKTFFDTITINSNSQGFIVGNMFVAKYDSVGNVQWVRHAGGINPSGGSAAGQVGGAFMKTDKAGNTYLIGSYFDCYLKFSNNNVLTGYGNSDIFLAKYNTNGILLWAKTVGWYNSDYSGGLELDDSGNVYFTGAYSWLGIFGDDTLTGMSGPDAFVAKFDKNGNGVWAINASGNGYEQGVAICLDDSNHVYTTGFYSTSPVQFGSHMLTSAGFYEVFVTKLSQDVPTSVSREIEKKRLSVYPNPNNGTFTIDLQGKKYKLITITDVNGRVVYEQKIGSSVTKILTINTTLPTGIYFLKLYNEIGMSEVKKLIIEN